MSTMINRRRVIVNKSTNEIVGECIRDFGYTENVYINLNNGSVVGYNGWSASDFIDVSEYIRIYNNASDNKYGAYYDENKNYIALYQISKPNNAKYMRYSSSTYDIINGEVVGIIR